MPLTKTDTHCLAGGCLVENHPDYSGNAVALVVNTFERTIEDVLTPGFFRGIENQNQRHFEERILLINNVHDRDAALIGARRLFDAHEVTAVHFVNNHFDVAMATLGLEKNHFGRLQHHSDCCLIAAFVAHSPYMLYWDAEIHLDRPVDWVEVGLSVLGTRPEVFCATARPCWWDDHKELTVETGPDVALGYGFSDQLFLVRTDDLRHPVYASSCPASARYPTSHVCEIFEQRIDAYMRRSGRYRAVCLDSLYFHNNFGSYWPVGIREALRFARKRLVSRVLKTWRWNSNPVWRI